MTVLEETLDKIAMLRSADQAGRTLAGDSSVELAKYAGAIMARMTKEALAPLPALLAKPVGKAVARKAVTAGPVTKEVRKLIGSSPTLAPGQLAAPTTSMGQVAQRMMKTPAPVGSVTPAAAKAPTMGGEQAVEKLVGRVPTRLPGVKETGAQEIMGRIQHGPGAVAAESAGAKTGIGTPKGKARQAARPAPAAAKTPELDYAGVGEGTPYHMKTPQQQAAVHANMRAQGASEADIQALHSRGSRQVTPGSPMGKVPVPYPQAAGQVAPGPAAGAPAYTPQPGPAARPYATGGAVTPPPAPAGPQTDALARLEAAHGPATGAPASPQQPGALTQYGQRYGIDTGGGAAQGLAPKAPGTVAAPQTDIGDLRPDLGIRRPESASFSGKATPKKGKVAPPEQGEAAAEAAKKGGGLGGLGAKALGLGALGLGAYGLVKGVPWAARQLEAGGAGSMAYGGGWSPTPYGYGYSPYGAGAPGATV